MIKRLLADDPEREKVLELADSAVRVIETGETPDIVALVALSRAYLTWKKIAEERQEHIDWHNAQWRGEGYDGMVRGEA